MRAFCLFLVVALVVGFSAAWWFGWWNVSTVSNADNGKTEFRLTVDKDRVKHDMAAAEDKVKAEIQALKPGHHETANAVSSGQPVQGTIRTINTANQSLTVKSDKNEEVTVRTDAATRIRVRDRDAAFLDLKIGDRAAFTYHSDKEDQPAKTITVETP
jgi:hypothetical protein